MLDDTIKRLATEGRNIAAVTTLMPDGTPQTTPVWIDDDDDHIVFNTEVERQKFRNVERDPRVTVTVFDVENPYRYVEARGQVVGEVRGGESSKGRRRRAGGEKAQKGRARAEEPHDPKVVEDEAATVDETDEIDEHDARGQIARHADAQVDRGQGFAFVGGGKNKGIAAHKCRDICTGCNQQYLAIILRQPFE